MNLAATVLDVLGARDEDDPPPLSGLDPAMLDGVRVVVLVLADGLGLGQLRRLSASGATPFLATMLDRAGRRDGAQLIEATTVFPSTTTAAITSIHTARTPQEHGNIAYFLWLEEFGQVTQMLRWGPAVTKRGSYFDDPARDVAAYVRATSVHRRIRDVGAATYVIEPQIFRNEPLSRMYAAEATYLGYVLASSLGVRLRAALARERGRAFVYAYWPGVDSVSHVHGPGSAEHDAEAAALDLALSRALAGRPAGDVLVVLTADHGHARIDPRRLVDLEGDVELRAMLRNPIAGEPRLAFLHTDRPERVASYLESRYPETFTLIDREEAIEAGLFGRGDPALVRRRVGEVCALLTDDRGASIVRVDGQVVLHRGAHGGLTADEMAIPVLAWRG